MGRPYLGRTEFLKIDRVPPEVRGALKRVAAREDRTVSATVRTILSEGLRSRGELQ